MDDFNITILNSEFIDEFGSLNDILNFDKENTYLSFEINSIPRILSKMIICKKLLKPTNNQDMECIKMIFFSNLKEYEEILRFLGKCIEKMPINTDKDIILYKYMEDFYSLSCELNLNNIKKEKKKVKRR